MEEVIEIEHGMIIPRTLNKNDSKELASLLHEKAMRASVRCEDTYKMHEKMHSKLSLISASATFLASILLLGQLTFRNEVLDEYDRYVDFGFLVVGLTIKFINARKKYPKRMSILISCKIRYETLSASLERALLDDEKYSDIEYLKRMQGALIKLDEELLESEGHTL